MKYKALLLDFYGTLAEEDDRIVGEIIAEISARSPLSSDKREIGRNWKFGDACAVAYGDAFQTQQQIERNTLSDLLKRYKVEGGMDAATLCARLFAHWQAPHPFEDATWFIGQCRAAQIPLCVVSNIDTKDLRMAIAHAGYGEFAHIVTSEECRAYKPRPEMFRCALELMGCKPEEALHVGDALTSDVKGARSAGIDAAWINRKGRSLPADYPAYLTPTYNVSDLRELAAMIGI